MSAPFCCGEYKNVAFDQLALILSSGRDGDTSIEYVEDDSHPAFGKWITDNYPAARDSLLPQHMGHYHHGAAPKEAKKKQKRKSNEAENKDKEPGKKGKKDKDPKKD
jgi:hypothetical protein